MVLPLISPTVFLVLMYNMIGSLKAFEQIYLLTGGGPGSSTTVLGFYVYLQGFHNARAGLGNAIGIILFLVVLILTLIQWFGRRRWVFNED